MTHLSAVGIDNRLLWKGFLSEVRGLAGMQSGPLFAKISSQQRDMGVWLLRMRMQQFVAFPLESRYSDA
ncbi:hypothetical protein ACYJW8_00830 [Frateuria aurantia]